MNKQAQDIPKEEYLYTIVGPKGLILAQLQTGTKLIFDSLYQDEHGNGELKFLAGETEIVLRIVHPMGVYQKVVVEKEITYV